MNKHTKQILESMDRCIISCVWDIRSSLSTCDVFKSMRWQYMQWSNHIYWRPCFINLSKCFSFYLFDTFHLSWSFYNYIFFLSLSSSMIRLLLSIECIATCMFTFEFKLIKLENLYTSCSDQTNTWWQIDTVSWVLKQKEL